jgi:cyclic pyranopterin phosphate synthase
MKLINGKRINNHMVNITHKSNTLRKAIAIATVKVSSPQTIKLVKEKKVPKGDVFEFSRAAGLLAVKKTSDVVPDCHPLPVEFTSITYSIDGLSIIISVEVHTIYKTGVEVEAMHGAAITAITIYDMLKPVDKGIEIGTIKLENKTGGKTSYKDELTGNLRCAVIVCSDKVASGKATDKAGKAVIEKLAQHGVTDCQYEIIPDEPTELRSTINKLVDSGYQLALCTGGTGLSPRDLTPDTIRPLLDREIPGIMETARQYGQQRMPYAMLSRGVAGFIKNTLVITLPGSTRGAIETMDALFPYVLHVFSVARGMRHDG